MNRLRICIVDESPFFRRWFRKLILAIPGSRIVGESCNPLQALRVIGRMKPDAVIMDAKAQWQAGVDLIRSIRRLTPVPSVIVLTSEAYRWHQRRMSEKADFLLDKITEYNRLPEILKEILCPEAKEERTLSRDMSLFRPAHR